MRNKSIIDVFIPDGYKPKKVEKEAAWILARNFKTVVRILRPTMGYKEKTPDFQIHEEFFELKTLTSSKAERVITVIRSATKQSNNIVIDARKTKIHEKRLIELCKEGMHYYKKVKKIILIIDKKKILDFYK